VYEEAGDRPGAHLALVGVLVLRQNRPDPQIPSLRFLLASFVLDGGVEPDVVGEGVPAGAQNVQVAAPDPGDLRGGEKGKAILSF